MILLGIFLILASIAMLGLAGLRTYGLILHNRRRRRRRKLPFWMDLLTKLLYVLALIFLIAGILTATARKSPADIPTEPPEPNDPQPNLQTEYGWQESNGFRYYLNPDGTHALGWLDVDGNRYYIGSDGVMATGWLELDGSRYYLGDDGVMAVGRTEVDGITRFFTATGAETLLVNPWNPVQSGYTPNLVPIDEYYGSKGLEIDSGCYEALQEMIDACNAESGSRAYVLSAYRSLETQQRLFDRKVQEYLDLDWSRAGAEEQAATVVALPGTSEHHLGLAVDIIDTRLWALEEEQEDLPAQQWLMAHCWEYGFLFRYPRNKEEITGIIYEPWHYRYVGKELAATLQQSGQTLEEYIDSLS